ncbi:MAG: DegV family protein [Defluviitaleaceae bacterium]|nr:DegV family protein [Defluviitaleaceae bacterium]
MKNSIVVDSACDLTGQTLNETAKTEGLTLSHVPLNLQIGEKVYIDSEQLNIDEFIAHMESSPEAVKTSAPSPSLFLDKFGIGDNVFVVTLSSKLSATYQSAMTAKDMYLEEYGKKFIHVFDSLSASIGQGVIAIKIAELLKKDLPGTEVVEEVNNFIKGMRTYFIIDKFDNLVKTGRINPYVAKVASLLNMKPICGGNEEGEIKMLAKARGYNKAQNKLISMIKEATPDIQTRTIGISHVKAFEKAQELKEEFIKHLKPKEVVIQEARGVVTTYANRGGLVIAL